jgi:hypothetical protein
MSQASGHRCEAEDRQSAGGEPPGWRRNRWNVEAETPGMQNAWRMARQMVSVGQLRKDTHYYAPQLYVRAASMWQTWANEVLALGMLPTNGDTGALNGAGMRAEASGTRRKEKTRPYVYRCTRCGTGWLATVVEPRDQECAVHVFLCRRGRYASQASVPRAVEVRADALPTSVSAGIVPVARLTGPGAEALRMDEIFALLGLRPDAPGGEAQRPALAGLNLVKPEISAT